MTKIQELKLRLKEKAANIVLMRSTLKASQKANGAGASTLMHRLHYAGKDYRSYHIAYCELRGRTRDQIEKPRQDNPANEYVIAQLKAEYAFEPVAAGAE